jgi:NAD(P)-dependent dehydrogenase (short-subunit alcohol dehydrogenase family)
MRTAIVTGASRGIGKAIKSSFETRGVKVISTLKDGSRADVCNADHVRELFKQTENGPHDRDGPTYIVNNAGVIGTSEFFTSSVNVYAPIHIIRHVLRRLTSYRKTPTTSIVNITSVGGQIGGHRYPYYAASKAALECATKSYARLLAPHCRVNAVAPGWIDTDMTKDAEVDLETIPLGRKGTPEEVAMAVMFLCFEGTYITGATIDINGGLNMR